jgi:hypothetical protein
MEWESIVNWLYALSIIVLPIIAFAGVGAWLDRRSSSTPEDVEQDIEQYGAAAGGIRSELLPEDERQEVLKERQEDRARRGRWAWLVPH